jgi:hypothetical protein
MKLQLSAVHLRNIANDKNGNMTKVPKPDNWASNYNLVYDAWNRLVKVYDTNRTTLVAQYAYDGLNRRVKKIVGNETRLFYFNKDWQCLEDYVNAGCVNRWVWGLRYVDDLIYHQWGGVPRYSLADPNWNVIALYNSSTNTIEERYTYNTFGKVCAYDESFVPRSSPEHLISQNLHRSSL